MTKYTDHANTTDHANATVHANTTDHANGTDHANVTDQAGLASSSFFTDGVHLRADPCSTHPSGSLSGNDKPWSGVRGGEKREGREGSGEEGENVALLVAAVPSPWEERQSKHTSRCIK